jgi:hypothetical protein
MTTRKTLMLAALISIAPVGLVMAQSQTPPQDTSPSSASSPSQREATSSQATESPTTTNSTTTDSTSPAAASTPHQEHATRTASKQAMKECVAKQKQDNQGMSSADAKKACKQQMKGSG